MKLREYFLCAKKNNFIQRFLLSKNSPPPLLCGAAESEHACAVPCLQAEESNVHVSIMAEDCPGREEIIE